MLLFGGAGLIPNSPPKLGGVAAPIKQMLRSLPIRAKPGWFTYGPTPAVPFKGRLRQYLLDGTSTPPNLGGEFKMGSSLIEARN